MWRHVANQNEPKHVIHYRCQEIIATNQLRITSMTQKLSRKLSTQVNTYYKESNFTGFIVNINEI